MGVNRCMEHLHEEITKCGTIHSGHSPVFFFAKFLPHWEAIIGLGRCNKKAFISLWPISTFEIWWSPILRKSLIKLGNNMVY